VLRRGLNIYLQKKKLGSDDGRTQRYLGPAYAVPKFILGPAQPMTQGYFDFYSMRGLRIVGSWRAQAPLVPNPTPFKCHVCVGKCPSHRQSPSATCTLGMFPTHRHSLSAMCAQGVCPSATCHHMVFLR
jgi:Pyruvate/2-oxoacid:ferredoxin oxidoreductase delta subunit